MNIQAEHITNNLSKGGYIAINKDGSIIYTALEKKDIIIQVDEHLKTNLGEIFSIAQGISTRNSEVTINEKYPADYIQSTRINEN